MARAPFVVRKDGRYFFHKRFSSSRIPTGCPTHLRLSLRTSDYGQAVASMLRVMRMVQIYEANTDFRSRSECFVGEMQRLNAQPSGFDTSDLVERRSVELLVNRFITEAHCAGHQLTSNPQFWPVWMTFCNINGCLEASALPRARMAARMSHEAMPASRDRDEIVVALQQGLPLETRPWPHDTKGRILRYSAQAHAAPSGTPPLDIVDPEFKSWEPGQSLWTEAPIHQVPTAAAQVVPQTAALESLAPHPGEPARGTGTPISEGQDIDVPHARPKPPASDAFATQAGANERAGRIKIAPTGIAPDLLGRQAPLSIMARAYLDYRRTMDGDGRAEEDAGIILQFAIDLIGDLPLMEISAPHFTRIENALPDIPKTDGIPSPHRDTLHGRWLYAQEHGWKGLKRVGEIRMRNAWHRCLRQFLAWARKKGYYDGPEYTFDLVGAKNPEARQRDAWQNEELIKFFSLPLFTGAHSGVRHWIAGDRLVQNYLYWAYLIVFLTGMRPSEISKLRVDQLTEDQGIWYFDLRKKEQVSTAEADSPPKLKTKAAHRLVPVHRLLIDLGLLDRREALQKEGRELLFPDATIYTNARSGRVMWGHEHSKSWQYVKKKFKFDRPALTLYGGRHTLATWYDEAKIPQRIRNRLLGHAKKETADGYGAIHLTKEEALMVLDRTSPVEEQIAEILITAKLMADYDLLISVPRPWAR